jgi:putative NADH-flavin reductase
MNTDQKLKLLLFGATRNTGFYFMQQALDAGHEVTVIIRNPGSFEYKHPNLKIVKGDALELSTFENEVGGKDAVISSLGTNDFKQPMVLFSEGVGNMIIAMRRQGVKRIMCVSAMALDTNAKTGFLLKAASKIVQWVLKYPYADLRIMEAELKSSGLDWTIVRPPQLKDNPVTGKYRVAVGEHLSWPFSIGRADVAHYMLEHVQDYGTYYKTVEVAN